jgi:uncharacterized protein with HEPN domain
MKREVKKYLYDIIVSIEAINEYLGEKRNYYDYLNNKLLRRGIEREIEIIGEAMNKILHIDPKIEITSARKIVDTRNWVVHSYDRIDDVIMWGIIIKLLLILKEEIELLMNDKLKP